MIQWCACSLSFYAPNALLVLPGGQLTVWTQAGTATICPIRRNSFETVGTFPPPNFVPKFGFYPPLTCAQVVRLIPGLTTHLPNRLPTLPLLYLSHLQGRVTLDLVVL